MNQTFVKFLQKTKISKEFALFLQQYQKMDIGKFAIIKISGSILENHIESVSEDIAFLNKFNLFPILVHGAGSSLDKVVSNKIINGIRYTSSEDIHKVVRITNDLTDKLLTEIEKQGGKAVDLSECLICDYLDKDLYGHVGKIISIDKEKISKIMKEGITTLFSNIGYDSEGNPFNINADSIAKSLFDSFIPQRMYFLTETGGVLDSNNNIISHINLSDFIDADGGMLFKLETIKEIIDNHPDSAFVITSAQNLIQEIFTIKGSGTFISNFKIVRINRTDEIDIPMMTDLLNSSFNKKLKSNYYENKFKSVYLHDDYKAVAIIKEIDGFNYLCKFAILPTHQGTGLAKYIWNLMKNDYETLIWRSKSTNLANNFYNLRCDGMIKSDGWHIYWYGQKYLPIELIEKISNIEESFTKGN